MTDQAFRPSDLSRQLAKAGYQRAIVKRGRGLFLNGVEIQVLQEGFQVYGLKTDPDARFSGRFVACEVRLIGRLSTRRSDDRDDGYRWLGSAPNETLDGIAATLEGLGYTATRPLGTGCLIVTRPRADR